jgi:hypothetical protein
MAPLAAKDDFQERCTVCRSARQGPSKPMRFDFSLSCTHT